MALKNQSESLKNQSENLENMSKKLDECETKTISMSQVSNHIVKKILQDYGIKHMKVHSVISIAQELINKLSSNVKVELNEFLWSDHNEGHPVNTKKSPRIFSGFIY